MPEPGAEPPTIAENRNRIRVVLGGFIVAETTRALTLTEPGSEPVHYIPREDAQMDLLDPSEHRTHSPHKGEATYYTVTAGGLVRENAAWSYESPLPAAARIAGHVAFAPQRVDAVEEFTS